MENNGDKNKNEDDVYTPVTANGETNVFARSGKLVRSPVLNLEPVASSSSSKHEDERKGSQELGTGFLSQLLTPKSNSSILRQGQQPERSNMTEVRRKVDELYEFIKDRHNVHTRIKQLVTGIKSAVAAAEREEKEWKRRAISAETALVKATEKETVEVLTTPKESRNPRSESSKRRRETPGEEEELKKHKNDQEPIKEPGKVGKDSEWRNAGDRTEKRKKKEEKEEKKKEERKKEKPRPRRERTKGDALIVEAKDKTTYAELLRKVRVDPELKELGENVIKTRRTQKGEILFELRKDPTIKSSTFKELVEKSLGNEANVRALSQEIVIECRDLDEITTAEELSCALKALCDLGEVPMTIRMRKAYGGMQTAAIRLSTTAANKLLEEGKVRVGWSVCPLKAAPRVPKQMVRCFKCMGFGHQARSCKGPDRSDLCRNCGEKGHVARDCTKQPRCMLCKTEDGNAHMTGGFKCPVYKTAMASQQ